LNLIFNIERNETISGARAALKFQGSSSKFHHFGGAGAITRCSPVSTAPAPIAPAPTAPALYDLYRKI
jgi:hypothetical protein